MDDTVCVNKPIIVSTTNKADSYYWNFCTGNLQEQPVGKITEVDLQSEKPAFIDFAFTDDGIYALVSNHESGTVSLLNYGSSLANTPAINNLGNFGNTIPDHTQGIQIVAHDGNFYGFVTGGQKENSKLVRLNFGNSMANTPVAEEFYFPDLLDYPIDLNIMEDNGTWYGFTVNYNTSTLVRYNYGNSPANTPDATIVADESVFKNPCGIAKYEENGNKYLLISNYTSHAISIANFGTSYENTPSVQTYGADELQYPFDLTIFPDCEKLFGFALNRFGTIVRMEFESMDSEPTFESLGETGYLYNPQGISNVYRVEDSLFVFVANIDNSSIAQITFPECHVAQPGWSELQNPEAITYTATGNFNVRLEVNGGTIDEEQYCKNIEVVDNPEIDLENEILLLPGETAELSAGEGYSTYKWSTGETSQSIETKQYGMYYVTVSNEFGCEATDSIEVKFAGIPTYITPNGDGVNDIWEILMIEEFPEAQISIFDRFGNLVRSYDGAEYLWDCTDRNNEPVRADSYWYIINLGKNHAVQKGHVTVIRSE